MEQHTQFWSAPLKTPMMLKRHPGSQCTGSWWQQGQGDSDKEFCAGEQPCVQGKAAELPPELCHYALAESPTLNLRQAPPTFPVATAQMMSAYVEIFSISAQSCSCSPWRCSCFHRDITGNLQLFADCLWGRISSISLVNSCLQSELEEGIHSTNLTKWIFGVDQHECTRLIYSQIKQLNWSTMNDIKGKRL